jgi:hypothetical protein
MVHTTINTNNKINSLPFPKLMIGEKGTIVFFQDRPKGFVIDAGITPYKIGFYSETWDMNAFTDFTGSITLQNEF